jgi:hypothetical protein
MKTCDYCGRENTDDAVHCRGCGTRFASEHDPKPPKSPERIAAEKKIFTGSLFCLVGFLFALVTSFSVVPGPFGVIYYVIACGAILFGGLRLCRGLADRDKQQSTEDIGAHALSYGTRLEAEGRVQEALLVYQQIILQYPDTDPARDAKKSIKNIHAQTGGNVAPAAGHLKTPWGDR